MIFNSRLTLNVQDIVPLQVVTVFFQNLVYFFSLSAMNHGHR